MKKFFWLTLTLGAFCLATSAQQAKDPVADLLLRQVKQRSLFATFSFQIKDLNKILLHWTIDSAANNDYFIVERGNDTAHFETLEVLKRINTVVSYELADNNALTGFNYYRIKCIDGTGQSIYSNTLQVSAGKTEFKFYPNPADKLLIVETEHSSELQILNPMGAILIAQQLQRGVQIVNVSSLERGEYIIRAVDKINNKVILEHLLKN
ncbi:MAG: T9SS type A sorting domain-containing protein [Bacteroidetes bacterium]|nr:T9SS type A sorting domain-containing protein [Bacteroidota bacterium]